MRVKRKWRSVLCLAVIAACLPAIHLTARHLPLQTRPLIEEKYAGWSGVLRIWVFEGWTDGDFFAGWLNRCAATYEKSHPGVYVEAKYVDAATMTALNESGMRPPDMLLFPPGMMARTDGLAALSDDEVMYALRGRGGGYAVPVAMGGYGWAVNRERMDALPADWSARSVGVFADEPYRRWSAALERLLKITASMEETLPEPPGLDLGLPALADAQDPWTQFANGELDAMPVTQREIARLTRLSDRGRGPDWTIAAGADFTDQVLFMAIPEGDGERQALAAEFLEHLLSAPCQSALASIGAFSVLDALTGYGGDSPYLPIDAALHSGTLAVPDAFAR